MGWLSKLIGKAGLKVTTVAALNKSKERYADWDISEPIFSFMQAVRDNPKRFSITTEVTWEDIYYESVNVLQKGYSKYDKILFSLEDKEEGLSWPFYGRMIGSARRPHWSFNRLSPLAAHIQSVAEYPEFLTTNEAQYLFNGFKEVYGARAERYEALHDIRSQREADKRQAIKDAANQAERKALMEVYCK